MNPLLAKNGFVVANIDYRLGFDPSDQMGIVKAFYRGAQDLDAALRYLVHNAGKYNIDTTAIFIGGGSAGGVLALANAYEEQSEWDAMFPMMYQDLGAVAGAGNNFTDNYSVRGVYSLWGGIVDTSLISLPEMKAMPVLLVQSQSDEVIPYEHAKGENAEFKVLYGSYDIAQRFKTNGGCYDLYFVKDARHGHGFSQAYVTNAITLFINDVLAGNCKKTTIENTKADNSKFFGEYKYEP
jgi:acetyl esterase/lipase